MSELGTKISPHIKDPDATLDFTINWLPFLGADTITSDTWTVPLGITSVLETNTTTTTTIWLSGGTLGTKYSLTNRVVTAGGRIDDRTIYVKVKAQ